MKSLMFVVAALVLLMTTPASFAHESTRKATPSNCHCAGKCPCDSASCRCERADLFRQKLYYIPQWPAPGSLPFSIGAVGRWTVGAPQRVPLRVRVLK